VMNSAPKAVDNRLRSKLGERVRAKHSKAIIHAEDLKKMWVENRI
jgi:hypothetical protein